MTDCAVCWWKKQRAHPTTPPPHPKHNPHPTTTDDDLDWAAEELTATLTTLLNQPNTWAATCIGLPK